MTQGSAFEIPKSYKFAREFFGLDKDTEFLAEFAKTSIPIALGDDEAGDDSESVAFGEGGAAVSERKMGFVPDSRIFGEYDLLKQETFTDLINTINAARQAEAMSCVADMVGRGEIKQKVFSKDSDNRNIGFALYNEKKGRFVKYFILESGEGEARIFLKEAKGGKMLQVNNSEAVLVNNELVAIHNFIHQLSDRSPSTVAAVAGGGTAAPTLRGGGRSVP